MLYSIVVWFFFSSRRRHTRYWRDWSSDVCSSDLRDPGLLRRRDRRRGCRRLLPRGRARAVRRPGDAFAPRRPAYKPARELYPWVDLQPSGLLRSLYTGHEWEPEALIRADLAIAQARAQELTARLATLGAQVDGAAPAEVEAALPFNCEHVVPQSWFAKREPMRGDLHHLFACEAGCNSFRGNTPFAEFADSPDPTDRKSTRLNSSHANISYAVFCLKKKKKTQ